MIKINFITLKIGSGRDTVRHSESLYVYHLILCFLYDRKTMRKNFKLEFTGRKFVYYIDAYRSTRMPSIINLKLHAYILMDKMFIR